MKRYFCFIYSCGIAFGLSLGSSFSSSFEPSPDRLQMSDSSAIPWISRLGLWADYGKLLVLPLAGSKKAGGGLSLTIKERVILHLEGGYARFTPERFYANASYVAAGSFIGGRVIIILLQNPTTRVGLGGGYGKAFYKDHGRVRIRSVSGLFGEYERPFARNNLQASWVQLSLESDTDMRNQWLSLGFAMHARILLDTPELETPEGLLAPGYGLLNSKVYPGLTLFVRVYLYKATTTPSP